MILIIELNNEAFIGMCFV